MAKQINTPYAPLRLLVLRGFFFTYSNINPANATLKLMFNKTLLTVLAVIVITALGFGFRFYDIQHYPAGLFPDEAANGEDALLILDGDYRSFYPRGNGREALYYYLEAISIKAFGIGVWQLHIVSALIGTLTVLLTYFATRVWFGRLSGLLAALFLATNHWHVTLSRTGFRAILIPLILALFTAAVGYTIRSVAKKHKFNAHLFAALAGASLMLGFYTYIAYRVMIGVILGIFVFMLLAAFHPKIGFPHFKRYGTQLLVAVIAGLLVFAPLGWYFIQHPADFVGRAGQVSVFNEELQQEFGGGTLLGTLSFTTRETLLSFFVGDGDLNWRHNVAGFPLLNPLVGLLFLLGLAWAINGTVHVIYKIFKGQPLHLGLVYPYLLLLLAGMIIPVITTAEGIPHALRSLGLLFPIFVLAGTAGAVILHWLYVHLPRTDIRNTAYGLIVGAIILAAIYDGALYFIIARNDAEAHYDYRADLTVVADYIDEYGAHYPDDPRPYLVLDKFSQQTIHFLSSVAAHEYTKGDEEHPDIDIHPWRALQPENSHFTVLQPGEAIIFTQSSITDADRYYTTHSSSLKQIESRQNKFGQEILRVYRLDTAIIPSDVDPNTIPVED